MEMDLEEFKRKYPHLALEMQGSSNRSLRSLMEGGVDPFLGYEPRAEDYIRRCNSEGEAERTIEWLLEKGELSEGEAEELKRRLKAGGLRGFGPRKRPGHYLRSTGYI
ncbi:MAG: DUF2095 family protein [Candidatus Bathyarchaeia archaeon]